MPDASTTTGEEQLAASAFAAGLVVLPRAHAALLPALHLAQETCGFVPDDAIERIAAHLRLTVNEIEGVVTGYPELRRQPPGQRVIQVCTGAACALAGGAHLLATLAAALDVQPGETTADGRYTLETVACCFVCAVAPVAAIDGAPHGRLNPAAALALLAAAPAGGKHP